MFWFFSYVRLLLLACSSNHPLTSPYDLTTKASFPDSVWTPHIPFLNFSTPFGLMQSTQPILHIKPHYTFSNLFNSEIKYTDVDSSVHVHPTKDILLIFFLSSESYRFAAFSYEIHKTNLNNVCSLFIAMNKLSSSLFNPSFLFVESNLSLFQTVFYIKGQHLSALNKSNYCDESPFLFLETSHNFYLNNNCNKT